MGERVGDVCDQRGGFRVDLAVLQAESAVVQCGRLPKRPLVIATGPTFAVMPSLRAPRRKISPLPPTGCGRCG